MNRPKPTDEYTSGQMMGMLVIIQMLENAKDAGTPLKLSNLTNIKRVAVENLAEYLQKPEEDVILLVDEQLRNI